MKKSIMNKIGVVIFSALVIAFTAFVAFLCVSLIVCIAALGVMAFAEGTLLGKFYGLLVFGFLIVFFVEMRQ